MQAELQRYLNDHLAGASGASSMIEHLIHTLEDPQAVDFFQELKTDVEEDRRLLEHLLSFNGMEPSGILKTMGNITARVGLLKLMWEGLEPGKLGLFEALEMLALGVHGKRLLWVALREVAPAYPAWNEVDFVTLEKEAIRQREGLEVWRIQAAKDLFTPEE